MGYAVSVPLMAGVSSCARTPRLDSWKCCVIIQIGTEDPWKLPGSTLWDAKRCSTIAWRGWDRQRWALDSRLGLPLRYLRKVWVVVPRVDLRHRAGGG